MRDGVRLTFLTLLILVTGSFDSVYGDTPQTGSAASRNTVEVNAGRGFVGKAVDILGSGNGPIFTTNWISMKVRPFAALQSEALGFQLGIQTSEDITKNTACRAMPEIAGRTFCSSNTTEYVNGPHFIALYSGIQAELIELISREPRPLQIYFGAGASTIQASAIDLTTVPYSSLEVSYLLRKQLQARAGLFVSAPHDFNGVGVAAPEVTLEYRF